MKVNLLPEELTLIERYNVGLVCRQIQYPCQYWATSCCMCSQPWSFDVCFDDQYRSVAIEKLSETVDKQQAGAEDDELFGLLDPVVWPVVCGLDQTTNDMLIKY